MPRNGAGSYALPTGNPVVTGTAISSTVQNNTMTDVATALTQSLAKDGQTTPSANLPMGSFRHTGVGNGVARTDYPSIGQVQDSSFMWCGTATGAANALLLVPTPIIPAIVAGQRFVFKSGAAPNSGATTVSISTLPTIAVQVNGAACVGSEILADRWYEILVDASLTSCQLNRIGTDTAATLTSLGVSAFAQTYLDDVDAATTLATLGALAKSGGTLTSYRETVVTANSTATYAMDCSAANVFNLTLTANSTLSFTNIPSSVSFGVTLALKQDATGSRTVTWPTGTRWAGGTAPTLTTTAAKTDFISLFTLDGGTNWNAFVGGKNF